MGKEKLLVNDMPKWAEGLLKKLRREWFGKAKATRIKADLTHIRKPGKRISRYIKAAKNYDDAGDYSRSAEAYKSAFRIAKGFDLELAGELQDESEREYKKAEKYEQRKVGGLAKSKPKEGGLAKKVAVASTIFCLLASGFFALNIFTGYAIADISQKSSNLFGIGLFILGVAGTYFVLRRK
jgi:hypothetical protein